MLDNNSTKAINLTIPRPLMLPILLLAMATASMATTPSIDKKCLYVSSFHEGHEWSDTIENSIREKMKGQCELRKVEMDSENNTSPDEIFKVTNSIIKVIDDWQPDVVITSDDTAAKYLIATHYRDDKTPFVFSGVNGTVDEYGFPFKNVTGIIEVAPIKTMLREAVKISRFGRRAVYLGPDIALEKKNFSRMKLIAEEFKISLEPLYYSSFSQWKRALLKINEYDFAVMGSNADTKNWAFDNELETVLEVIKKPTFTTDISMMPYTAFGFTKLATEQGEWAAEVAIRILNGTPPNEIPMASNKKWEFWVNEDIISRLSTPINRRLLRKAKRLQTAALD